MMSIKFVLGAVLCLPLLLTGCGLDGDSVSITIEQRETQVIPGLGLDGRVSVSVGDIETSDLISRGPPVMEELEIKGPNAVLLRKRNVGTQSGNMYFSFDGQNYEVSVTSFNTSLIRDDEVTLTFYRL